MKGKILFLAGLGIGYVLGTRAGRERYESLKKSASKLWNNPRVQKQVDTAEAFVKDRAPDVAEFALDGAKKVVAKVTGKKAAAKPGASSAKSPAAKSGTAKSS